MAVVKVEHSGLPEHQVGIMQQFREFWMEGHFCDLTVKSREGTEHRAHAGVLSAAGKFFKTLLCGSFLEADQVKHGQPVQINASDAALRALLEYIYGGQPDLPVEESIELLRLAGAYELPKLAKDVEAGIRASLKTHPVPSSLRVLQETHGLHDLKAACEEAVATNFEVCAQHPDFLRLSAVQLAQILERDDLKVSREEVVLKGIFTWFNSCKDRGDDVLGLLLRDVDFQSISFENLHQLSRLASSFGPNGDFLQRRVTKPCKQIGNESRQKLQMVFARSGVAFNTGRRTWVLAQEAQGKCYPDPVTHSAGIKVFLYAQISPAVSFAGSPAMVIPEWLQAQVLV
ncbi:KLHL24 [Symbiodinium natans]|uniref:KLHL24 protein n=1 Tax=Symbiodinium natans TaxID=878477 RepID=A0A812MSA5_9DINO|nr:KLHL24 [Symbiodinium natans]